MRINPIINNTIYKYNNYSFKGEREAREFVESAKDLLERSEDITPEEYMKTSQDSEGSFHSIKIDYRRLFGLVPMVGYKSATPECRELLSKIKERYNKLEEEEQFYMSLLSGAGRIVDNSEWLKEINF